MQILQTLGFQRTVKKLHAKQKEQLDKIVKDIIDDPLIGEQKRGDLGHVRVFKFKMDNQLTLLAYTFDVTASAITLLALGVHEISTEILKNSV